MLTPQFILRVLGIAALVVAVLFAVLAVHYYLTQNIRAVMDDLSGKARARGVTSGRRRAAERTSSEGPRGHRAKPAAAPVRQGEVEPAPQELAFPEPMPAAEPVPAAMAGNALAFDEDEAGTMLVSATSLGALAATSEDDLETMVGDATTSDDDLETMVGDADELEDDLETMVGGDDAAEDDLATMVESEAEPSATPVAFRLTRNVVMIHSAEIIASREELSA